MPLPPDPTVLLGRRPEFDLRSRRYRINQLRTTLDTELRSVCWPIANLYDQGVELSFGSVDPRWGWDPSSCVGFSRAHALMAAPHEYTLTPAMAFALYRDAQFVDEWADTPPAQGSSVLAGAKAAVTWGSVDSYWWALTQHELVGSLSDIGPGVAGSTWLSGMFRPNDAGFIHPTGTDEGGHAYCLGGLLLEFNAAVIYQSWGAGWNRGLPDRIADALTNAGLPPRLHSHVALIDLDELWGLLQANGEYCISIDHAIVAPVAPINPDPQPIPEPAPTPDPLDEHPGCLPETVERAVNRARRALNRRRGR